MPDFAALKTFVEQREGQVSHSFFFQHDGVMPFKCDQCSFETWEFSSWRCHKQRHSSEKKYKCTECDYQCIQVRSHCNKQVWTKAQNIFLYKSETIWLVWNVLLCPEKATAKAHEHETPGRVAEEVEKERRRGIHQSSQQQIPAKRSRLQGCEAETCTNEQVN